MISLVATLHTLGATTWANAKEIHRRARDDRGSVTMEQVLWAIAIIAIVAVVVAAITAYVTSKSGQIA